MKLLRKLLDYLEMKAINWAMSEDKPKYDHLENMDLTHLAQIRHNILTSDSYKMWRNLISNQLKVIQQGR